MRLTDVLNLYLNVSWTFPSITDDVVGVLEDFLDNGGNLFIAGQDIGWDQKRRCQCVWDSGHSAFYSDYMHATYIADGSTANSSVTFEAGDLVFGNVPRSQRVRHQQLSRRDRADAPAVPSCATTTRTRSAAFGWRPVVTAGLFRCRSRTDERPRRGRGHGAPEPRLVLRAS